MPDRDHDLGARHVWVASVFYALTADQAEAVATGAVAPTVGTLMDQRAVGCKDCDVFWSPATSDGVCRGAPPPASKPSRNAPCPGGCGQKVKRCACSPAGGSS